MSEQENRLDEKPLIGYLNTLYPAVSHTFIYEEIRTLRELGVHVVTFSIGTPQVSDLGDDGTWASEQASTIYIGKNPLQLLVGGVTALLCRPLRFVRTLLAGVRASPGGLLALQRHIAYVLQAIRLCRACKAEGIQALHVHMANNGAMVARLATVYDTRLTYSLSIHGSAEFFDIHRLGVGTKATHAVFVRCISNFCRSQVMLATRSEVWERLHVVHCGIDVQKFEFVRWGDRAPAAVPQILFVGRLAAVKGLPLLLAALARIDQNELPWRLVLIGDGPEREQLEHLAAELGLAASIRFMGVQPPRRVRDQIQQSRLLIVPSFAEGVPTVLMEAMACGTQVLSTRVGGVPELLGESDVGDLCDPGSTAALEVGLRGALLQSPESDRLVRARGVIEKAFDRRVVAPALLELLKAYGQIKAPQKVVGDGGDDSWGTARTVDSRPG